MSRGFEKLARILFWHLLFENERFFIIQKFRQIPNKLLKKTSSYDIMMPSKKQPVPGAGMRNDGAELFAVPLCQTFRRRKKKGRE